MIVSRSRFHKMSRIQTGCNQGISRDIHHRRDFEDNVEKENVIF